MALNLCFYLFVCICMCMGTDVPRHECGGQGKTCELDSLPLPCGSQRCIFKLSGLVVSTFTHYAILLAPKFYLLLLLLLLYLYMSNVWMLAHPCKTVFKSLSSFCLRFVRQNSGSYAYIPSTFTQQTLLNDHRAFSFLMTVVKVLAIMSDDLSLISEPMW